MTSPINELKQFGQSFWYDNIQRSMLTDGALKHMIEHDDLMGITSNPSIFEKAINGSTDYDESLNRLALESPGLSSRDYFYHLAIEDIKAAADLLLPVYQKTNALDGYVSIEVSPDLAYNTAATITEARELVARINKPNLMIKVPATREGVPAVEQLTADGININATLLFSPDRYVEIAHAYIRGLQQRHQQGNAIDRIASVASFFVSRVDNLLETIVEQLDESAQRQLKDIRGKIGVLNAKCAYVEFHKIYAGNFTQLSQHGARPQRLLWASTGTKNPQWSDVLYIDSLIGNNTVNTIPPATLAAFKDHGKVTASLEQDLDNAPQQFAKLSQAGVDVSAAMQKLEDDGVAAFATAFENLTNALESKMRAIKTKQSAA